MRLLVLVTLATMAASAHSFSLPPGVDMREIKYLMSIVDPPTCGCVLPTACEVHIPNAHFVGLRCNGQQVRFCCKRKRNPNAKTNFRLTPELVEKTTTTSDRVEPECYCVETSKCRTEKVDFSFGKSCGFGFVRCCGDGLISQVEEEDISHKDNTVVEEMTTVLQPDNLRGKVSDHASTRVQLGDHFVPRREDRNITQTDKNTTQTVVDEVKKLPEKVEVFRPPPKEKVTVVTPADPQVKVVTSQSRDSTGTRNSPKGPPLSRKEQEETYRSYMKFVEYHNELFRRQQARRRWQQQQQDSGFLSAMFKSFSDMLG